MENFYDPIFKNQCFQFLFIFFFLGYNILNKIDKLCDVLKIEFNDIGTSQRLKYKYT